MTILHNLIMLALAAFGVGMFRIAWVWAGNLIADIIELEEQEKEEDARFEIEWSNRNA